MNFTREKNNAHRHQNELKAAIGAPDNPKTRLFVLPPSIRLTERAAARQRSAWDFKDNCSLGYGSGDGNGNVLKVGRPIESLVVVDAEGIATLPDGCACSSHLGWEETGGDRRHDSHRRPSPIRRFARSNPISLHFHYSRGRREHANA
jgi:hypothetical protein